MNNFRNSLASLVALFVLAFAFSIASPAKASAGTCTVNATAEEYLSPFGRIQNVQITAYSSSTNDPILGGIEQTDASGNATLSIAFRHPFNHGIYVKAALTGWDFRNKWDTTSDMVYLWCENGANLNANFVGL